jgi:hypothetical protein
MFGRSCDAEASPEYTVGSGVVHAATLKQASISAAPIFKFFINGLAPALEMPNGICWHRFYGIRMLLCLL